VSACSALAGARRDAAGEALAGLVSRWLGGWPSPTPPARTAPTSPADVPEPGGPDRPDPHATQPA
jgi:hypothetical protein